MTWAEMVERERRRRLALSRAVTVLAALGMAAVLAVLVSVAFGGCAHQPTPAADTIVLNERTGGPVAFVLGQLTGQTPKATTLPYLPTIVFQPQDANDTCLMVHEGVHRMDQVDMGGATWGAEYLRELVECERSNPPAECLRTILLEAKAYDAQHACMRGGS
jgi:hypothetical protein